MHSSVTANAESSTHQLVGYVTKMFPTFGYINNEIFFQKKCVIGPMVEVGDNVATSAIYQPNMPIKWSAEKVWRVQESHHSRSRDRLDETEAWVDKARSPQKSADKESLHSHDKAYEDRHEKRVEHHSRRRSRSADRKSSRSHERQSSERSHAKRQRLSPGSVVTHTTASTYSQALTRRLLNMSFLLNAKELLIPELRYRFPSVFAPVDLYRVVCHWQNSFPLLKPFYPEGPSVYQILNGPKDQSSETKLDSKQDSGYFVNVLLLSMPKMTSLQEKTVVRAENVDRTRGSLRKYIQVLTSVKANEGFKAIGGSWRGDLDGADPVKDPRTLINTAIRTCKEQLNLDLSSCTQWHRFLEFRYGRTEGSTARPTSVLFPGTDLWGRKYSDPIVNASVPSKPFHKIVVYFLPDVWSIVPTTEQWPDVKKAFETLSSKGQHPLFPLTPALYNQALEEAANTKREQAKEKMTGSCGSAVESKDKDSMDSSSMEANAPRVSEQPTTDVPSKTLILSNQAQSKENGPTTVLVDGTEKSVLKSHEDLNLSAMKVSELREQLKVRNLPADGIKAQLLNRLKTVIEKEAEEARKLEEERKQKEKQEQEAQAAKELQAKQVEAQRQQVTKTAAKSESKSDSAKANVHLRNYPSVLIQPNVGDCRVQNTTLEDLLEPKQLPSMDAAAFELMFCAHTILEMLHRDAIFILFRALVTAGDRGVQAKAPTRSGSRSESKQEKTVTASEAPIKCTVDVPLLFACTMLDINSKGYFQEHEAEGLIASLGLPVSRYQIRSLITKVSENSRIHYRTLTDAELTPGTVKSKITYSEIDDDEYLLELIRGGDAVLEESVDSALPTGSVLVFHAPGHSTPDSGSGLCEFTVPNGDEFTRYMKCLEMEKAKLLKQLKNKSDEIARLRSLSDRIPTLRNELETANATITDLKRRLKHDREQMHAANRVIEQQIYNLDSSRSALRQASNRLRGRADNATPAKKSTTPTTATTTAPSSTNESKTSGHIVDRTSSKNSTGVTQTEVGSQGKPKDVQESDRQTATTPMEMEPEGTENPSSKLPECAVETVPAKAASAAPAKTDEVEGSEQSANGTKEEANAEKKEEAEFKCDLSTA